MSELFQLKHCEECKGTGIVLIEKHDCDCPDCLGTGYEEPAKRIMNLELMLNEHKMALKSSDAHNNDLAQKLEIAWDQRDGLKQAVDCASDLLSSVTEQRNEARRLAEKYRNLSCDSQDEADETLLPWETTNPNEL